MNVNSMLTTLQVMVPAFSSADERLYELVRALDERLPSLSRYSHLSVFLLSATQDYRQD